MRSLRQSTRWTVFEELPEYPAISVVIVGRACSGLSQFGFSNQPTAVMRYHKGAGQLLAVDAAWRRSGQRNVEIIRTHPARYQKVHELLHVRGQRLRRLIQRMQHQVVAEQSSVWLLRSYQKLQQAIEDVNLLREIVWSMEQPHEFLTDALIDELRTMGDRQRISLDPVAVLASLSTPTDRLQIKSQGEAVLHLAARPTPPTDDELQALVDRYGSLTYGMVGPSQTMSDLRGWILEAQAANPVGQLLINRRLTNTVRARNRSLIKQLKPDSRQRLLLKIAQWIGYDKGWSKEIQFAGHAVRDRILRELGRRQNLTLKQLWWVLPNELGPLVLDGTGPTADELNERWRNSAFVLAADGFRFLTGKPLVDFDQLIDDRHTDLNHAVTELRGRLAVAGSAKGIVKRIESPADMVKMNHGDILISSMTIPEIVPAMRKAAAIVTDEGGLTCHAAIVSRELGIPCLIGTKIATKVFHDGDLVEVNTAAGFIRKVEA